MTILRSLAVLFQLGAAVLLGTLWLNAEAAWWKAFLLMLSSSFALGAAMHLLDLDRYASAYLPRYLRFAARESLAVGAATTYYLWVGGSVLGKVLSAGLLVLSLRQLVRVILHVTMAIRSVHQLKAIAAKTAADGDRSPFLLITAKPRGQAARHVAAFVASLGQALWRYRSASLVRSERSDLFGARLERVAERPRSLSSGFTGFLSVIFNFFASPRSLVAILDTEGLAAERELAADLAIAQVAFVGSASRLLMPELESPSLLSLIKDPVLKSTRLNAPPPDRQLLSCLHRTAGPCFLLPLSSSELMMEDSDEQLETMLQGYEIVEEAELRFRRAHEAVAKNVRHSALAAARSDSLLDPSTRSFATDFAAHGLAPLADVYLRFRIAVSDLERFVVLLECFEALIKYSSFALLAGTGDSRSAMLSPHAVKVVGPKPPSMGTWVRLLRTLSKLPEYTAIPLLRRTSEFWERDQPTEAAHELVRTVNRLGVGTRQTLPKSNGLWLEWLTSIRNITRGHGGLQERTSALVWHGLHRVFLESLSGLRPLVLGGQLVAQGSESRSVHHAGWRRGLYRHSTLDTALASLPAHSARVLWQFPEYTIDLAPFTVFRRNECWTWNGRSRSGSQADYVDYASGKIARFAPESPDHG